MSGISDWFNENEDNLTSGSTSGVLIATDSALGLPPGTLTKITDLLIPGLVDDTLGAVFANGMDWSCWGSATNPAEQKIIINDIRNEIIQSIENVDTNTVGGAEFVLNTCSRRIAFERYRYDVMMRRKSSWASCTKKAWKLHIEAFAKLQKDIVEALLVKLIENNVTVGIATVYEPMDSLAREFRPDYIGDSYEKNDAYLESRGTPFGYEQYTIDKIGILPNPTINMGSTWWLWVLFPIGLVYYGMKFLKGNNKRKFKSKKR